LSQSGTVDLARASVLPAGLDELPFLPALAQEVHRSSLTIPPPSLLRRPGRGKRATACSVLIVTLTYLVMHIFPISIG
jgi:hypothetical protein